MPKDNTYLWEIQWQRQLLLLIIICLFLPICHTSAQPEETKIYTKENPLVYEDAEDLWPYAYLNDEGQPEGFNIDLVEKLMKDLNIPYVVRLKPAQEAFDDLKTGKADLTVPPSDARLWLGGQRHRQPRHEEVDPTDQC